MKFEIIPYVGVGSLKFGMEKAEVRNYFNNQFQEFKKTPFSETFSDNFGCCHVLYNKEDTLEAIEFIKETEVMFFGNNILDKPFLEVKALFEGFDDSLSYSDTGFTSFKYGVGVYVPIDLNRPVDSVIVFDKKYSDSILRNSLTWQIESFIKAGVKLGNLLEV